MARLGAGARVRSRVHLRAGGGRVFCGRKLRGLASPAVSLTVWGFYSCIAREVARWERRCGTCSRVADAKERRALALHLPGTDGP